MSDIDQFSVTARRINKGMSQDPYLMGKNLDAWSPLSLTAMGYMAELGIRMGTPHMI